MAVAAVLLSALVLQSGTSVVNIPYGRSWPRSIVVDAGRQLVYVDGMSGINPPEGFSFGVIFPGNESAGGVLGLQSTAGELALDGSSGTVYVAGDNSVTVIDGPSMTIERTIGLKIPIFGMVFDASTGYLLLTSGNRLFQLDPATGRLLRNATVGEAAEGMAVDAGAGVIFVASYLSSSISVLRDPDLATVRTIKLPQPSYPSKLALDDRRGLLFATTDEQTIVEVSTSSYEVVRSIQVSQSNTNGTYALAVDAARDRIFVATEPGTVISELNETSGALLSTFAVFSGAYEIAVDQTTGKLFVTDYHQVTVITPAEATRPATLLAGYPILALLVVASAAAAACLYIWKFRPSGGRPDGLSSLLRIGRSSRR